MLRKSAETVLTFRAFPLLVCRNDYKMTQQDFDRLSHSIRGRLQALAGRFIAKTGIAEDAGDIAQEALITLWRLDSQGYPIRDAEALAVRITKNLAVARYRRRKVEVLPLDSIEIEGGASATSLTDSKDNDIIRTELYSSLTPTQRRYLELRNELGLSLDEIAELTGSPKSSIKTTISTARKQMLEQINKQI